MQVNRNLVFTVDQLELIRRLRNSGLTKEQVLSAFDSFDCLDGQVNKSVDIPMTLHALQMQALQCLVLAAPSAVATGNGTSENRTRQQSTHLQSRPQRQRASLQQQLPRLPVGHGRTVLDGQGTDQPQQDDGSAAKSASESGTASDNSSSNEDVISDTGGRLPDGFEEREVSFEEMREFFSQGEVACLEEIKDFIQKHSIKQQQIAVLAGVSQPYVSRYLRGDFNGMSDRSCCAIKKWYLTYRTNPTAIGLAVSSALMMVSSSSGVPPASTVKKPTSQASIDLAGIISSVPAAAEMEMCGSMRRERFVFRSNQLQILERSFADDNYPSYDRREDLAKSCNESTQDLVGRELTEKETITVQIVSNWFANRRKDLKKLYKEEGLDPSQVPLRSRGRPSHSYLDLPLVQSILSHRGAVSMTTAAGSDSSSLSNGTVKSDTATGADNAAEPQFSQVEMEPVGRATASLTAQKSTIVKTEMDEVTEHFVGGQTTRCSPCMTPTTIASDRS